MRWNVQWNVIVFLFIFAFGGVAFPAYGADCKTQCKKQKVSRKTHCQTKSLVTIQKQQQRHRQQSRLCQVNYQDAMKGVLYSYRALRRASLNRYRKRAEILASRLEKKLVSCDSSSPVLRKQTLKNIQELRRCREEHYDRTFEINANNAKRRKACQTLRQRLVKESASDLRDCLDKAMTASQKVGCRTAYRDNNRRLLRRYEFCRLSRFQWVKSARKVRKQRRKRCLTKATKTFAKVEKRLRRKRKKCVAQVRQWFDALAGKNRKILKAQQKAAERRRTTLTYNTQQKFQTCLKRWKTRTQHASRQMTRQFKRCVADNQQKFQRCVTQCQG